MLLMCACQCGSSEGLIKMKLRKYLPNRLSRETREMYLTARLAKGHEQSNKEIARLPVSTARDELAQYIDHKSKWAIFIGTDGTTTRWVDIASNNPKQEVELELLIDEFA